MQRRTELISTAATIISCLLAVHCACFLFFSPTGFKWLSILVGFVLVAFAVWALWIVCKYWYKKFKNEKIEGEQ